LQAAIDYNAPLLTLAAMHVMNDTADPFYTCMGSTTCKPSKPSGGGSDDPVNSSTSSPSSSGQATDLKLIIAVAVPLAGLVVTGAIVYALFLCRRRGKGPFAPARQDPKI